MPGRAVVEFLLSNSSTQRVNLSYEGADLRLSYEFGPGLRVYGGGGGIFDQEPSDLKPWYAQGGLEFRSPWPAGARICPREWGRVPRRSVRSKRAVAG